MTPIKLELKDDGIFPNSKFPVLIYKGCFEENGEAGAEWLETTFAENDWTNSWRNGVYDYHHYHSNTHEVLGVYSGEATLLLGGGKGEALKVSAGDVIVIPAGVAHKDLGSENFGVVGAYPEGRTPDINTGKEGERPAVDNAISAVPLPEFDPLYGKDEGIGTYWKLTV